MTRYLILYHTGNPTAHSPLLTVMFLFHCFPCIRSLVPFCLFIYHIHSSIRPYVTNTLAQVKYPCFSASGSSLHCTTLKVKTRDTQAYTTKYEYTAYKNRFGLRAETKSAAYAYPLWIVSALCSSGWSGPFTWNFSHTSFRCGMYRTVLHLWAE